MYIRDPETHHLVPVDLVFPVEGGGVEGDPRAGFGLHRHAGMRLEYLEKQVLRQCRGRGVDLPGGEISCHFCTDGECKPGRPDHPGVRYKCEPGVFTCQRFYGCEISTCTVRVE